MAKNFNTIKKCLEINDVLGTGKYANWVIADLVDKDPDYLRFMHTGKFYIFSQEVIDLLMAEFSSTSIPIKRVPSDMKYYAKPWGFDDMDDDIPF